MNGKSDIRKVQVTLAGLRPIMFDRYPGSNEEQLPPEQKVYLSEDGKLVFPAVNISSFLSSQNTESAPQRVCGKKWKAVAKAALSFVDISPIEVPFVRNGKPLTLENAGLKVDFRVARMKKGQLAIPNPKQRPVLGLPWELSFELTLFPNPDLTENILRKLFEDGGIAIGFGTYRGVYGKFAVSKWQ